MALADYKKCYVCQGKALYDGDDALESRLQGEAECEVLCENCAQYYTLVALPMATTAELLEKLNGDDERGRLTAWGALNQLLRPVTAGLPSSPSTTPPALDSSAEEQGS